MNKLRDERGSTLLLIIGMTGLALALIVGVMDATSLYLERKRLFTLADGAALVAAQSFDASLTLSATNHRPQLTPASVHKAVTVYLATVSANAKHCASLVSATTPDSKTAVVQLHSTWHPPIVSVFMPGGIPVEVSASARSIH